MRRACGRHHISPPRNRTTCKKGVIRWIAGSQHLNTEKRVKIDIEDILFEETLTNFTYPITITNSVTNELAIS